MAILAAMRAFASAFFFASAAASLAAMSASIIEPRFFYAFRFAAFKGRVSGREGGA